jgi:biotin carboxylase
MPTRATCASPTKPCCSARPRRANPICVADKILDAAKRTGAQAVHPGYGFLSENADFADACAAAGITFIGPPASAIRAMGSKSEAKTLMGKAAVPLTPGYHGDDPDPALLHREADQIGYPVLIKAAAGGGGKGMRLVEKSEDFPDRWPPASARRLQLRRRSCADREIHHQAAPHRNPGLCRYAGQLRLSVRARLLGAAPPPESAGRSARPPA